MSIVGMEYKENSKDYEKEPVCEARTSRPGVYQIAFAGDADLSLIRGQLKEVKEKFTNAEFVHLFLPRKIVEEKGFDPKIVDLLDEILGENQHNPLAKEAENFDDFMSKIDEARVELATKTDLLIVLGVDIAAGVIKEVSVKAPQVIFWK